MRQLASPVLFLDFDGVLHPDAVYRTKWGLLLQAEGQLFQWSSVLEAVLQEVPEVSLVLSTSWVRVLGYSRARSYLPECLQSRVVGGTWHRRFAREDGWDREWAYLSRFEQITHYVARRSVERWLALDNDNEGWPVSQLHRLVLTDDMQGLGGPGKADELLKRLKEL